MIHLLMFSLIANKAIRSLVLAVAYSTCVYFMNSLSLFPLLGLFLWGWGDSNKANARKSS